MPRDCGCGHPRDQHAKGLGCLYTATIAWADCKCPRWFRRWWWSR